MQREAEAELKKQDEKSIMVYPNQDVYRFGTDYNVGDYVTVISKSGIMLHLQIIQANYSGYSTFFVKKENISFNAQNIS